MLCLCPPPKIFIDRDPTVFAPILNFLRTKELDPRGVSISLLLHEAQFYGITPLGDDFGGLTIGGILGGGLPPQYSAFWGSRLCFSSPPKFAACSYGKNWTVHLVAVSSSMAICPHQVNPTPPPQHHIGSNHPLTPLPKFLLLTSPNSLTSQTP